MIPTKEKINEMFDEKFGKKGPEGNCDSIGRKAGCDDCSSNIKLREEHKAFLHTIIAEREAEMVRELQLIVDEKHVTNEWRVEEMKSFISLLGVTTPQ